VRPNPSIEPTFAGVSLSFICHLRAAVKGGSCQTLGPTKEVSVHVQRLRILQRQLAFVMPAVIALFGLAYAWSAGFPSQVLLAAGGLFVFGVTLAVSLYKRSRNHETAWFSVRVRPDPPGAEDEPVNPMSVDFLFVVGAFAFMLMALLLPYMKQ
jgi:hypothetical protein